MKFKIESDETGQSQYYIDNKEVSEKTYYSLSDDVITKNIKKIPKTINKNSNTKNMSNNQNINNIPTMTEESCDKFCEFAPEAEYLLDLVQEIKASDDEAGVDLLLNEIGFVGTQLFLQGQIEVTKLMKNHFKMLIKELESNLEEFLEECGIEEDEDDG